MCGSHGCLSVPVSVSHMSVLYSLSVSLICPFTVLTAMQHFFVRQFSQLVFVVVIALAICFDHNVCWTCTLCMKMGQRSVGNCPLTQCYHKPWQWLPCGMQAWLASILAFLDIHKRFLQCTSLNIASHLLQFKQICVYLNMCVCV